LLELLPFPTRRSSDLVGGVLVFPVANPAVWQPGTRVGAWLVIQFRVTNRFRFGGAIRNYGGRFIVLAKFHTVSVELIVFQFHGRSEEHTSELQSRFDL